MDFMRAIQLFLILITCTQIQSIHNGTKLGIGTRSGVPEFPYVDNGFLLYVGDYISGRKGGLISAFRGIHYAIGLRFQPPVNIYYGRGERVTIDARKDGPACPQYGLAPEQMSEECLILNVYTYTINPLQPDKVRPKWPVLIYFHGGAFYNGSAHSDFAGPQYLLEHNLILVTIQYRLGAFGFLSTGTPDAPGNIGLKDQVMGLKWVQDYIENFGGDKNLVTLAGSGAGAQSVALHMLSPLSRGLFHRALVMGGSSTTQDPIPRHQLALAKKLARIVNCTDPRPKEIVECLKGKPWKKIADTLPQLYEFGYDPVHIFRPVIEPEYNQTRFLTESPEELIKKGSYNRVPLMLGRTQFEYGWRAYLILRNPELRIQMDEKWASKAQVSLELGQSEEAHVVAGRLKKYYLQDEPLTDDDASAARLGKAYQDGVTGYPVYRLANLTAEEYLVHGDTNLNIYYYQFSYQGEHSNFYHPYTGKSIGAVHGDELIYLLGMPGQFPLILDDNSFDGKMIDCFQERIRLFATYGKPNPDADPDHDMIVWPRFDRLNHTYLNFGTEITIEKDLNENRYTELWDILYGV